MNICFIPILFVRYNGNLFLRYPRFKHEGTVSDKVTGFNPVGAEFFNYMKRYGIKGIVCNNIDCIRSGAGQLYFKGFVIDSLNCNSRRVRFTGVVILSTFYNHIDHKGILRTCCRGKRAQP